MALSWAPDELEYAQADLDMAEADRSFIVSALRRLEREGSVSADHREKLQGQIAALDRWISHYRRILG